MTQPHSTLYRLYRPARFDEMRGQEHIVGALTHAISEKNIAHAYLFSGGRGTGKTTAARIFSHALGVSDKDIIEIDAASNRGIDDIRELREGVWVTPFESPYKVYIIDEAHMLTKEAWNALLKTLEEPPAHAIFILATTERDKVPDTIQSRCEVHTFRQPSRDILRDLISTVSTSEGYSLEPAGIDLVALLAEGSFRDALSILQQVLASSSTKKVTVDHIETVTSAPRGEIVRTFLKALAEKDTPKLLETVGTVRKGQIDVRTFTRIVIHRLRAILLTRFAPQYAESITSELTEADQELITTLAKDRAITSETVKVLLEAHSTMAYATIPALPLELAIMDMTQ